MKKFIYLIFFVILATNFCIFFSVSDNKNNGESISCEKELTTAGFGDFYSYETWGADAMGVPEYSEYLSDILEAQGKSVSDLPEVVVAVIDTGIETYHPWFKDRFLYDENGKIVGRDYTNDGFKSEYPFEDIKGHGTFCAGIICDMTMPNVKILPIKFMSTNSKGENISNANNLISIVDYLIEMKQKYNIVAANMSFAHDATMFDGILAEKIKELYKSGIMPIAAAANDNLNAVTSFPASVDCAITVSAIDSTYKKASFSNYGKKIDVCAPGMSIHSATINEQTRIASGTSAAAPHIAAYIALLKSDPTKSYSQSDIEKILSGQYKGIETILDLGEPGKDIYYGYGMPILHNLIPSHTSVTVETNLSGAVSPSGFNLFFQDKKEFILKVFPTEEYKPVAIYFDGVEVPSKVYKTEYMFMLTKKHEIRVEFGIGYKVNHYLEPIYDINNPDCIPTYDIYELKETEILYGKEGSTTTATANTYQGFTPVNIEQKIIDKNTEIDVYYKRNIYKLTIKFSDNDFIDMNGAGEYLYGTKIEITTKLEKKYNSVLWEIIQCEDKNLRKEINCNTKNQTFEMPASNLIIAASAYHEEKSWWSVILCGTLLISGVVLVIFITRPLKK